MLSQSRSIKYPDHSPRVEVRHVEVLPYMGYLCMCGTGFSALLVVDTVSILAILV